MINFAHRGASEYAPENTLSSFYLGLMQGANGIETDVRKTKDGVPILFHDETLDRVSNATGKICDFTYEELKKVKIFAKDNKNFYDRIITLREFLQKFSCYDITFAIELKGKDVEKETLEMVKEFFYAVSYSAKMNLHLKQLDGSNNHHLIEAAYKSFARRAYPKRY